MQIDTWINNLKLITENIDKNIFLAESHLYHFFWEVQQHLSVCGVNELEKPYYFIGILYWLLLFNQLLLLIASIENCITEYFFLIDIKLFLGC